MILRRVAADSTIASMMNEPNVMKRNHVTFAVTLEELATNDELLRILGLVNIYAVSLRTQSAASESWASGEKIADEQACVNFMRGYLDSFLSNAPAIKAQEELTVMVVANRTRRRIIELFESQKLKIVGRSGDDVKICHFCRTAIRKNTDHFKSHENKIYHSHHCRNKEAAQNSNK